MDLVTNQALDQSTHAQPVTAGSISSNGLIRDDLLRNGREYRCWAFIPPIDRPFHSSADQIEAAT